MKIINDSPLKKDVNDGSNDLHLETRSKTGEDIKDEQMPVDADNQADIFNKLKDISGGRKMNPNIRFLLSILTSLFGSLIYLIIFFNIKGAFILFFILYGYLMIHLYLIQIHRDILEVHKKLSMILHMKSFAFKKKKKMKGGKV